MPSLSKLVVELGLEPGKFDSGLSEAKGRLAGFDDAVRSSEKTTGRFGETFKGVLGGMLAASVISGGFGEVKDQIGEAIKAGEEMQQTQLKTNALFGDGAEGVSKWAEGAATSLGLSDGAAQKSADVFGNLFKNIGFTTDSLPGMSENMVGVVANVAAFNNADPSDVLNAIQKGVVGSTKGLKQYGIVISQADIAQEALNETGKASAKDLTTQEKTQAAYNLIMAKTADLNGTVAARANTLAGASRILHAQLENLREEIGLKLIPIMTFLTITASKALTVFMNILLKGVLPLGGYIISKLIPIFKLLIAPVKLFATTILESVRSAIALFTFFRSKGVDPLSAAVQALGLFFQDLGLSGIGNFFENLGESVASAEAEFAFLKKSGLDPLSAAISAISLLFADMGLPGVGTALTTVSTDLESMATAVGKAFDGTKSFHDLLEKVPGKLKPITLGLIDMTSGVGKLVRGIKDNGIQGFADAWTNGWRQISNGFGILLAGLVGALASIGGDLLTAFTSIDWAGIAKSGWDLLTTAIIALATKGIQITTWVLNVGIPAVGGWLASLAVDAWSALKIAAGWAGSLAASISDWSLNVAIPAVGGWLASLAVDAWGALKQAAGWTGKLLADIGEWTLNIAASPQVAYAAGMSKKAIGDAVRASFTPLTVDLPTWTLSIGLPSIAFGAGFSAGLLVQRIIDMIGHPIAHLKDWAVALAAAPAILFLPGIAVLAPAIAEALHLGPVNLLKWTLEIAARPFVGMAVASSDIATAMLKVIDAEKLVVGLVSWTLNLFNPLVDIHLIDFGAIIGVVTTGLQTAASAAGDALAGVGVSLISGIMTGWTNQSATLQGYASGLPTWVLAQITDAPTALSSVGSGLIQGVESGWTDESKTLQTYASGLTAWVLGLITDAPSALLPVGHQLLNGVETGWTDESQNLQNYATGLGSWVADQVGNLSQTLWIKGTQLINGLEQGWSDESDTFVSWAQNLGGDIASDVGDLSGVLYNAGVSVIQSLWNGMKDQWQSVVSWLSGLAGAIPGYKGPPAKDARILIDNGRLVMHGFGVGLAQGWTGVTRQLSGYTPQIPGAMSASVPAFAGGGMAGVAAAGGSGGGGNTYNLGGIVINGANKTSKEMADEVMTHVDRALRRKTGG